MGLSYAIASNARSSVMGLEDIGLVLNPSTSNLVPAIGVFGEANHANQSGLSTAPVTITGGAAQAAALWGYGSPIWSVINILFPQNGSAVQAPVIVFPQAEAAGAAGNVQTVTFTGTATASGILNMWIAGRTNINGQFYQIAVASGDTPTVIATKFYNAINAVLGCPMVATHSSGVLTLTAKWYGLSSESITVSVDSSYTSFGLTAAVAESTAGTGTPAVTTSLDMITESMWIPAILSCYALEDSARVTEFVAWCGVPSINNTPNTSTGRWVGTIAKPSAVFMGSTVDSVSSTTTITEALSTSPAITACMAPGSLYLPMEAAADRIYLECNNANNDPASPVLNVAYPNVVPPKGYVAAMCLQANREIYCKAGCSTVNIVNGRYVTVDNVTTYFPAGILNPVYSYTRDLWVIFNKIFSYQNLVQEFQMGKIIVADESISKTSNPNITSPKLWKAKVAGLIEEWESNGWSTNSSAIIKNTSVAISTVNPNRLDTYIGDIQTSPCFIGAATIGHGFYYGQ